MPKFGSNSVKSRLGFFSKNEESEETDWNSRLKLQTKSSIKLSSYHSFKNNINDNEDNEDDGDNGIDDEDSNERSKKTLSLFTRKNRPKSDPYNLSERPKSSVWNRLDSQQMYPADPNWLEIVIPGVHKFEKDLIISALSDYIKPHTFVPIMYKVTYKKATFYVDNQQTAEKILTCNDKIIIDNYFKVSVNANVITKFPLPDFDQAFKLRIQKAMSSRYFEETKSLDLSCFHHDPTLIDDYFCGLFRPEILTYVLEIASEAVPHLEALNLENNKLSKLEKLSVLNNCFKNLKILYLGNNKIKYESTLDYIKELKLQELRLEGNELINRLQKMNLNYSTVIREKFPTLVRLDGKQLPKIIEFDIEDSYKSLLGPVKVYASNQKVLEVAQQFIQLYFNVYDSDSRQPLLDAYLDNAIFSMTIDPKVFIETNSAYSSGNRNLLGTRDPRRIKLLSKGRLRVVSFLSGLPKTQHLVDSFTLDVIDLTASMIITVTGLFKEQSTGDDILRHFCRTFIVEPFGTGYCIRNEQFHLADYKPLTQVKIFQQFRPQMPVFNSVGSQNQTQSLEIVFKENTSQLPESIKEHMTRALSERTRMNADWSYKCLSEVNWVYDNAIKAFEDHNKRGNIPPEAFS